MSFRDWLIEKLNPVQPQIAMQEGDTIPSNANTTYYTTAYRDLAIVRRGVDMIVNGAASFDISVMEQLKGVVPIISGTRVKSLTSMLNYSPNPFQDINSFRRLVYEDFILEGNAFIYTSEGEMYHLPAASIEVLSDPTTYVKGYRYSTGNTSEILSPKEVMHVKDNSSQTVYRGTTRLAAAEESIRSLNKMLGFQSNFFDNGAVPGLVLTSENVLGESAKARMLNTWQTRYNPKSGGKRPMILDGGLKVDQLSASNFAELDFVNSTDNKERAILKALGVPPILLDGGNNANIAPNLKLFYLETVLPVVRAFTSVFERYFGYDLEPETAKVSALQPQMSEASSAIVTLVNGGIITPNEARIEMRYDKLDDPKMDEIREPKNIAGSATDPSQGGRPPAPKG